jgi:ABC-type uncharacterized transport system auxiliary subunit
VRRLSVLLAGLLLLAGCAGGSGPPADSFYRLDPGDVGRRYGQPLLDGTVQVARFSADGVTGGRPIVYRTEGSTLRQYNYHYWVESPAKQMQDAVIAAMRDANAAPRVVSPDLRVLADWRVDGTLRRLDYDPGPDGANADSRVIVRLELSLVDTRNGDLVLQETFEATRRVPEDSVPAAVESFNAAATDLLARFLDRIDTVVRRRRDPS